MFGNTLAAHTLTTINALTPPRDGSLSAQTFTPTQPPGTEGLTTVINWILWGAALVLFVFFIFGLVSAGRNRRQGNEIEAPIWPMAAACLLGASGAVWTAIT
ncbi:hypothetical protein FQ377_14240 [Arthrobacter echini]|uniref:Uncharacterized protein n=1 Tax=Arthrobacter echini TaxID=1529066 RepID=A0A5D0XI65_9MICC|nr:hypothetical protein [Arthrobacter echini]TYC96190.1 hypothetical protein FQ377_14240 [Arthrobacter echini]